MLQAKNSLKSEHKRRAKKLSKRRKEARKGGILNLISTYKEFGLPKDEVLNY